MIPFASLRGATLSINTLAIASNARPVSAAPPDPNTGRTAPLAPQVSTPPTEAAAWIALKILTPAHTQATEMQHAKSARVEKAAKRELLIASKFKDKLVD